MTDNPFRLFYSLGYHDLLPIIPPNAELSPDSNVTAKGKVPGSRNANGQWVGRSYKKTSTHERDLDAWHAWGAGVGIRGSETLLFVDVDHHDKDAAQRLHALIVEHLGPGALRFGRKPGFVMAFRTTEHVKTRMFKFGTPSANGKKPGIDFISDNLFVVAHGIHAGTGKPYTWHPAPPAYDTLTEISPDQVRRLIAAIDQEFGIVTGKESEEPREPIDPETLRAPDMETLRKTLAAVPNSQEMFPTREHYIAMLQAIKGAAGPENDAEGLELWLDWCARWDDATRDNDPDVAEADWHKAHDSRQIGFAHIQKHAVGLFFQPVQLDPIDDMFAANAEATGQRAGDEITFHFQPVSIFADRQIPERDWIVPNLIPNKTVTLLMGDGGTGKSLLALQLAVAVSCKREWLGQEVADGPVVVISAEDDEDELHRRFTQIFRHYDIPLYLIDNLRFLSLAGEDAVIGALQGEQIKPTKIFHFIEAEVQRTKPKLVVFDTLADLFGGNEINRTQTRQFIGLLRGISIRHDCASLLLGHPSVAGMQSGSGSSGSTAWSNSVRSRLYLERVAENGFEPNPDMRRLTTKKSNYGRVGGQIGLRWTEGVFVPDEAAVGASGPQGNAKAQAEFLAALERFTLQGRVVSSNPGANYAPSLFAAAGGAGFTKAAFKAAMDGLFAIGAIRLVEEGRAGKRRTKLVAVSPEERGFPPEDNLSPEDVFS